MNSPAVGKLKYTYYENKDVLSALKDMAAQETVARGRNVTVGELVREISLQRANQHRSKIGKRPIKYDTAAGKFAPGAFSAPAQAVVDSKNRLTVYDRRGNVVLEWKTVKQIPDLLRSYRKVKVSYDVDGKKRA